MVAYIKMGVFLLTRDTARSVAALEKAIALARRRVELAPAEDDHPEKDLAWCEHNLGTAWQLASKPERAVPHYARAIAHLREGARTCPR